MLKQYDEFRCFIFSRRSKLKLSLPCFFLSAFFILVPDTSQAMAKPIDRKVLALYDSDFFPDYSETPIHLAAEMPLNHIGLDVHYHSIHDPLPDEEAMKGFRGVLTWFQRNDVIQNKTEYCQWLNDQMKHGRKVVILGNFGFFERHADHPRLECQQALGKLGLFYGNQFINDPLALEIVYKDPGMVEFERKLSFLEGLNYNSCKAIHPKSHVYLRVRRLDIPDAEREKETADLVMTTPSGGYVYSSAINYYIPAAGSSPERTQWYLNPFRFFREAFDLKGMPAPDTTTLNGRRLFYSHIDGDGFFNLSYGPAPALSGRAIRDEILRTYSYLPITVSLITGYFDLPFNSMPGVRELYHDIFSMPNVEPASHGYAHPLEWKKGTVALKIPGYTLNLEKEVRDSVLKMDALLGAEGIHKKTRLFLWTGDCNPPPLALKAASDMKILNLNGGGARFDKDHDSVFYVRPLGLDKAGYRQIYASSYNENNFTNLWKGPFYGYSGIIDTFKGTESPIRLKPMNIYYHFYSGEHRASLEALKKAYDFALTQAIYPVHAADYAEIAMDFFETSITPLEGSGFRIRNHGALRSVRFDDENRYVDLAKSQGVLGFRHYQGALYVFLDGRGTSDVYLTVHKPNKPYLIESNADIRHLTVKNGALEFDQKSWLPPVVRLGGLPPLNSYRISIDGQNFSSRSDLQGEMTLSFPEKKWVRETSKGQWKVGALKKRTKRLNARKV